MLVLSFPEEHKSDLSTAQDPFELYKKERTACSNQSLTSCISVKLLMLGGATGTASSGDSDIPRINHGQ